MKNTLMNVVFIATILLITACSREVDVSSQNEGNTVKISDEILMSKDELEIWLRERYGEIQPGLAIWGTSGEGSRGPFVYNLSDGATIQIEGYATKNHEYFVDPSFDLSSLPDSTQ